MDGESYIPAMKSRQPGSVKSASVSRPTSGDIATSDHATETGKAKYIGFDLGSQLQKKDTGIHIQP
jgi:hypothetical protein